MRMVELLTQPPPPEAIARMTAIEGVRVTPTVVATQEGPDRHLGPEAAGAVLILQATFVDQDRAADFWAAAPSCSIPTPSRAMSTTEAKAFLDATLPGQIRAERALHNGDLTPRLSTWSQQDPVTLFGAGVSQCSGWSEVHPVFEWLATTF